MSLSKHGLPIDCESSLEDLATRHTDDLVIQFPGCPTPTLGVEREISLVDPTSGALVPKAPQLIEAMQDPNHAKAELFQTILEINTDKCNNVHEVRNDLRGRLERMQVCCDQLGIGCIGTGTHPFSYWGDLPITEGERYSRLVDAMQWPARRLLICGMHVHVGVRSGEHAIALLNSLTVFLPHLLAMSASSPYWRGEDTGLASARVKVFEGLPTAGLPPRVTNWNEFVQLMRTLLAAKSITSIREIWWDIRPHPGFGTIELRICDGMNTLQEVVAMTAFIQCLVAHLQDLYDEGSPLPVLRHWTLRENKWRAARFGIDARLIRNEHGDEILLADHVREWIDRLGPTAEQLGCGKELASLGNIFEFGPSSSRQRRCLSEVGDLAGLVRGLVGELRNDQPWGK